MTFYPLESVPDGQLKFAIITARFKGQWVLVRHQQRLTWEIPGGHHEENESILQAAGRELYEETGAKVYRLDPVCVYSVENEGVVTFGQLFFAEVDSFGPLPNFEIEEVRFFEDLPQALTYPLIQPLLHQHIKMWLKDHYPEMPQP